MDTDRAVITHVMEPVLPGTLTVMTVGALAADTRLYAFRLPDTAAGTPGEPAAVPELSPVELPILQRQDECVTADFLPQAHGVYALCTTPSPELHDAFLIGRPRLDWHYPGAAAAGGDLRLIGRNLVSADNYPTVDPAKPVSFGGLLKGKTTVLARREGDTAFVAVPVRKSSAYEAHLRLPPALAPGRYELFAHNGRGGAAAWSEPVTVTVHKPAHWPRKVFRVDDHRQDGEASASPAAARALAALTANGGGILEFGCGSYLLTDPIVLPRRTVVRGQGHTRTLLTTPGDGGPLPPYVLFTGDGDFVIEELRVLTVYTGIIVCAPTFRPATLEEAISIPFRFSDTRASRVTVRRCHFTQRIASHCDRSNAKEHVAFINRYVISQGQGHAGFSCVHLRGDNLEIGDNTFFGGGSCVILSACTHARVAGNTLKAGPAGHAFYAIAKLTWPADDSGAVIRGNYASEILLEDNDISAYSERARDLVYFIYGSEHAHVARNHIHDIEPTFDAEGLGCHLWSARWREPGIRMLSPTTGEIVDPTGEVTRECLDGAIIDVVGGRGLGQLRRLVKREGNRFEIDRPWRLDPDASSDIVFTAPPPFWQMTFVDNVLCRTGINVIVWGNSNDVVLDGNDSSDGIGISVWSIRLPADQKVWGGAVFTMIINNTLHMNWFQPDAKAIREGVWAGGGICNPCTKFVDCTAEGYDMLGYVVRNNFCSNQSGILFKTTFTQAAGETLSSRPVDERWTIRHAGVVMEGNLIRDSKVGLMLENGARVLERGNRFENVEHPVVWTEAHCGRRSPSGDGG